MKKNLYILILLLPLNLFAQKPPLEITPLLNYHLGGSSDFSEGDIDIQNSQSYGAVFSLILPPPGISLDFTYTRADSILNFTAKKAGFTDQKIKMASNYFLIGANKEFGQQKIKFFLGGDIGAAWFDAKDDSVQDVWSFAADLKAGMKFYFNDKLGLRAQGRFLAPLRFSDAGFFLGIGGGGPSTGIALGASGLIFQGDFGLGLIIRL